MSEEEFNENELLFDELYEKTKDCGRVQFINLLMEKERENQELKKQLSNDHQIKKEFIEWLENRIVGTSRIISTEEDENNRYHALVRRTAYKEMLSKYKEIIGVKDE